MEPNMRKCRIRRRRSIGMKKVRAGVDIHLGAIDTTNVNRKRRRERKDNQKSPKQYQI